MTDYQPTIDKKLISEMPKVVFPGRIIIIYTEDDARKAVAYLNRCSVVGVDTETRPSFKKGKVNSVALLQVATSDTCFLFRLNRIGIPDFLEEFLQNDVLKIGLSLRDDFNMLHRANKKSPEDICHTLRRENLQEPAPFQLGSRRPDRSTATVCRYGCMGYAEDLSEAE